MLGGPCGGQPGAVPRGGKAYGKGGFPSKRKMPLKGLRKGGYIQLVYREKKNPGMIEEKVEYEGTIIDKRVGWDNRESYVELENCTRINEDGEIVAKVGTKRLFDAFIEECEEVEKVERPLCAELREAAGGGKATGMNMMEAMMPAMMAAASGGMMPMAMGGMGGMPMGMMPMMGMGGMGGMPMGMMGMPMMGMMPMNPMGMMGMQMMGMPGTMPTGMGMTGPQGCMGDGGCGSGGCGCGSGGCCGTMNPMMGGMTFQQGTMPSVQSGEAAASPGVQGSGNRSRSRSRGRR